VVQQQITTALHQMGFGLQAIGVDVDAAGRRLRRLHWDAKPLFFPV